MISSLSIFRVPPGKWKVFCGGRSTESAVLRFCIALLLLGLFYQTFILHANIDSHTSIENIRSRMRQRLEHLSSTYDQQSIFDQQHLDLGPSVKLNDYSKLLDKAARNVFVSTESARVPLGIREILASSRSAIELAPKNGWALKEISHRVSTTLRNVSEMPEEFGGWERVNPGWEIDVDDDEGQSRWVKQHLTIATESALEKRLEKTNVLKAFEDLPRPVLKSDLFRYLKLFLDGGVWGDSDTSSVVPVEKWGQSGTLQYWTDPILLDLDAEARDLIHGKDRSIQPKSINEAPPALIVAIETVTKREDSEGGHLVQYAFASAPGHPMLLDLLQHVVDVSHAVADLRAAGDNKTWKTDDIVFTWTGPEVWSSAVWRYLWARWGFDSRQLNGVAFPVRVGDVLILPYRSFNAQRAEPYSGQPPEACLYHGWRGFERWKGGA